jgi:predicted transcriptional regulator
MQRGVTKQQVNFKLSKEVSEMLSKAAKKQNRTKTAILEMAIRSHLSTKAA